MDTGIICCDFLLVRQQRSRRSRNAFPPGENREEQAGGGRARIELAAEPMKLTRLEKVALVRAAVSIRLAIVLAVITGSVAALGFEWHHAQAARSHQKSSSQQMPGR